MSYLSSPAEAQELIFTRIKNAWESDLSTATLPIRWPNQVFTSGTTASDTDPEAYLEVTLVHENTLRRSINGILGGKSRFEVSGTLVATCYAPEGSAGLTSDAMAFVLAKEFSTRQSTDIQYQAVSVRTLGRVGVFHVSTLEAQFKYDTVY